MLVVYFGLRIMAPLVCLYYRGNTNILIRHIFCNSRRTRKKISSQ